MNNLVLLIEDEETTGGFLKRALESKGIDVEWAKKGEEVFAVMKKGKFDLVILDLQLPEISGDEILEQLRKVDFYVEVIVYTNHHDPLVVEKLINLRIDGFIRKGADADLWDTVKKIEEKLAPYTAEEREMLLSSVPKDTFQVDKEG